MIQANDNLEQGNRGGHENSEGNLHKSQRYPESQRHQTTPHSEKEKQEQKTQNDEKDKFSPGEPDDYNAEEFSTD